MKHSQYPRLLAITAGVLLLLAIPPIWPYAYFQILRWVVTIAAAVSAYRAYELNKTEWTVLMAGTAILFNPIAPIFLAKGTWVVLDVVAAVLMFLSVKKLAHEK